MHQTRGRPCGDLAAFIATTMISSCRSLLQLEATKQREQALRGTAHCIADANLRIEHICLLLSQHWRSALSGLRKHVSSMLLAADC